MELFLDGFLDAIHDTWQMLPMLYIMYWLLGLLDQHQSISDQAFLRLRKYGPLFGALLGLLPQCGFAVLAAILYVSRMISLGTLVAVFIATSDEAIPVMIANPGLIPSLGLLLVGKFILAMMVGFVIDYVVDRHQNLAELSTSQEEKIEEESEQEASELESQNSASCVCCNPAYPLWLNALFQSLKIYSFIFLVTLVLNWVTMGIGEETLAAFLQSSKAFQPILAALFGFIPNCAATVVLCELYAAHALTFGSLLAGLSTNAGLGLVALFQYDSNRKTLWKVILWLFIPAVLAGYALQLLPLWLGWAWV